MKKPFKTLINQFNNILYQEIEKLSEKEVKDILEGRAKLEVHCIYSEKQKKSKQEIKVKAAEETSIEEIVNRLQQINSKQEGRQFLQKVCPNKKALTNLAKQINVPIIENTIPKIRESIIESTIGFRLRSSAIRKRKIGRPVVEPRRYQGDQNLTTTGYILASYINSYVNYVYFLYSLTLFLFQFSIKVAPSMR